MSPSAFYQTNRIFGIYLIMRSNIFLDALKVTSAAPTLRPGLEGADSTVDLSDIHQQVPVMPKKAGPGEDKAGDEHPEPTKEIGDESDFGSKDQDWVAQSQMHTVALEAMSAQLDRFSNMAAALEEIADTVESQLDVGRPLDPVAAACITTAIDASEVGAEPLENQVALEAFGMDLKVATEGFVDRLRSRAGNIREQWIRGWQAGAKVLVDSFREAFTSYSGTVEKLKKASEEYRSLGKVGGKDLGERDYAAKMYAAPGDKTVIQAFERSLAAFSTVKDAVLGEAVNGSMSSVTFDKKNGVREDQARAAASDLQNKVERMLALLKKNEAYSVGGYEVDVPNKGIDFNGDIRSGEYRFRNVKGEAGGVHGSLKTATIAEVEKILDEARMIEREYHRAVGMMNDRANVNLTSAAGKAIFGAVMAPAIMLSEALANTQDQRFVARANGYMDPTQMRNSELVLRNLGKLLRDLSITGLYNHAAAAERNASIALKWIKDSYNAEKRAVADSQ